MTEEVRKTCIIYSRVSSKEQVEGTSLEMQEKYCREYAERQGWKVLSLFVDKGESAKTIDRTEFTKAISFCSNKKNSVSYFLVFKVDRFARNAADHLAVRAALKTTGTELRSVSEQITEDPMGKFFETLAAASAELDNSKRSVASRAGMEQRVKEGMWMWSPPIGYYKPALG
ncbi:MAG: recombinase family protein, partial [Candidatus Taylorbacteria bacterium]|nr:recombinase family protein [Candidatus Taylorbacteria bacterium]